MRPRRQADLLGAQILARAGYDPRQMANMFKTIEAQGGSRGPEFMSSHPNPGNRYNAINKEAASLRVQGNAETGQFASVKQRLAGMSPALTAEQIAANQKNQQGQGQGTGTDGQSTSRQRRAAVGPGADVPPGQLLAHHGAGQLAAEGRRGVDLRT